MGYKFMVSRSPLLTRTLHRIAMNPLNLPFLTALSTALATSVHLPPPSGPYGLGFTQHIFNHTTLNDPTPGPGTNLLISIYYPTISAPTLNNSVPYFDPTSAAIWGEVFNIAPKDLLSIETVLQWQAPILTPEESQSVKDLPTLVFGPGGGVNAFMYTSLLSDLASKGYVILAMDHPGEAPYLPFPYNNSGVTGWDIYMPYSDSLIQQIYEFRLSDILFLISEGFPTLVQQFGAYFNTQKYGAFGHSMGAAQATGAMDRFSSIIAGINIDGGLYGDSVNATLNGRPYLMTMNPTHFASDTTWPGFIERYAEEVHGTGKGWLDWTTVVGSAHLALSDIPLWVELLPKGNGTAPVPSLGNVTGGRTNEYMRMYFGAFWDWVSGGPYDGVLEGEVKEWPEVVFNATVRSGGYATYDE